MDQEEPLSLEALFRRVEAEERARKAAVSGLAEAVAALCTRIDGVAAVSAGMPSLAVPCEQLAKAAEHCCGELLDGQAVATKKHEEFTLRTLTNRVSKALSCQSLGMQTSPRLVDEAECELAHRLRRLEAEHVQLGEVVAGLSREARQRTAALRERPSVITSEVALCETAGTRITSDAADAGVEEASDGSVTHAPSTRVGTPALPPAIVQMPPIFDRPLAARTEVNAADHRGAQLTTSGWTSLTTPLSRHGQMPPCSGQGGGLSVSSDVTRAGGPSIETVALRTGSNGSSSTGSLNLRAQPACSNSPGRAVASFFPAAVCRPPVQQFSATPMLNRCVSNGAASPSPALTTRPVGGSAKVYPSWTRPQFATNATPSSAQVADPSSPMVGSPVLRSYRVPLAGVQASPQQIATGRERRTATGALSPWLWPAVSVTTTGNDLGKTPSPRRSSSPAGRSVHIVNNQLSTLVALSGSTPPSVTRTGSL
mmetsp:Transcript_51010/g.101363  ORF Transcript_51010/g.101363 Transcript_51010/m.101363 type:complete len:483 (-) Transcript_51010:133-1581(-)